MSGKPWTLHPKQSCKEKWIFKRDYFPVSRDKRCLLWCQKLTLASAQWKACKNLTSFADLNLDITKQRPVAESTNTSVRHLRHCYKILSPKPQSRNEIELLPYIYTRCLHSVNFTAEICMFWFPMNFLDISKSTSNEHITSCTITFRF